MNSLARLILPAVRFGAVASCPRFATAPRAALQRRFASTEVAKLCDKLSVALQTELQHEKAQYEQPDVVKGFLEKKVWKLEESEGDVNMRLKSQVGPFRVTVEFQLVVPTPPLDDEEESGEVEDPNETTDFSVCVEKQSKGILLYCTTVNEEDDKFVVSNIRYFDGEAEKNSTTAYNGPDYEDLDVQLKESMQSFLKSLGIDNTLCNFVDAMAVDKEQREYVRWLEKVSAFVQAKA